MDDPRTLIAALIGEGESFTYDSFSQKGDYGYPASFTPGWVAWLTRVKNLLGRLFGERSAPMEMLRDGIAVPTIGNGRDKFDQAKGYLLGALRASADILSDDRFGELSAPRQTAPGATSRKVFVVHGHDDAAKSELEALLNEMSLEPIVLHRQPDKGRTLIEKFEEHGDAGYAIVLLTPDDIGYVTADDAKPDSERAKELRARQNVIFEFGYFAGRLGRSRVCCLFKGDIVLPSDLSGLVYKRFLKSVEEVAYNLRKELVAAGYLMV